MRRLLDIVGAPIGAFAGALVVGAVLIAVAGQSPLAVYATLLEGTLGSAYAIGQTIAKATPLVFCGLSVAVAFRAGLFNVGAEGQMTVGGLCAAVVGVALAGSAEGGANDTPAWIVLPLTVVAAAVGGALTAAIPAWLRAWRGVHEVISTIMMNFIAAAAAGAVVAKIAVRATVRTEELADGAHLPRLAAVADAIGLSSLADALRPSPANTAALLAIVVAVVVGAFFARTIVGFELRVLGENARAAAVAGVDVKRTTLTALLLAGALAGLGGTSFVLGAKYYYETGFAAGAGFTGIAVALLGRSRPAGVVAAALLFGALSQGGLAINAQVSSELVTVLQAVTIFLLIAALGWRRTRGGAS